MNGEGLLDLSDELRKHQVVIDLALRLSAGRWRLPHRALDTLLTHLN